ncbi:MAG: AAA family ATPase [Casimicrobiaceae bacterium]
MIRVKTIIIQEFRGIRHLTIDFNLHNFAICGPNGTGKSGVVDALEFALTGNISRLSGKGTGEISLKDHAPHVDSRNRPDKAKVVVTLFIPSLNKTVTIERVVSHPANPVISDSCPAVLEVLKQVAAHPEFALSRRELIHYVLSPPGDRAKEVQALLRLDSVESLRGTLLRIANASKKEADPIVREKTLAQENLLRALEITQLHKEKLLEAANARRKILELHSITELTTTTSLKDGLAVKAAGQPSSVPKVQALTDINRLKDLIADLNSDITNSTRAMALEELALLNANPLVVESTQKEHLLQSAFGLIDENGCPVCDTRWNPADLKQHVARKLVQFKEIANKRTEIEKSIRPLAEKLLDLQDSFNVIRRYGALLKPAIDTSAIEGVVTTLSNRRKSIQAFIPIIETIGALEEFGKNPKNVTEVLTKIEAAVVAIPEPTKQDAAREYLTVAQERLENFRAVAQRLKTGEEQAKLARAIYDVYVNVSTEVLDGIYKAVAKDFAELYSYINNDDERDFSAKLTPSMGKLGFGVDFYGRGHFPPGAYHSEGHQDGMGLCLYLALMKHLLGDGFTFAVLDDVLMSVDTGHRREVCNLLKERFSETQFILTTHDPIWLKHMRTVEMIGPKSQLHFRSWHVDHGPTEWDGRDVWGEIAEELKKNNVHGAAGTLRRYLEYFSKEVCHSLRAPVEFRGDAQYQLGDLLPAAVGQFRKHLKGATAAARSWRNKVDEEAAGKLETEFATIVARSTVEQWQMNATIHYNDWDNLSVADFKPVVDAFRSLTDALTCSNAGCGLLYVSPEHKQVEALRCNCGATNMSLRRKKESLKV